MDAATSFLWGKSSFVSFCFVLSSFTCFLFVEGWERVVCVWFVFPPLVFSFAKAHRRNLCLLHDKQKNCPHTVNHEHCFHINSSFGGLFVPFFFHFGLDLVCLKNKIINFQKKKKIDKDQSELVSHCVVSTIRAVAGSPERTAEDRCTALCPKESLGRSVRLLFGVQKTSLDFIWPFSGVIVPGL